MLETFTRWRALRMKLSVLLRGSSVPYSAAIASRAIRSAESTSKSDATATPADRVGESSVTEKIKQLGVLHAAGVLTQEEFETKKTELLSRL